MTWKLNSNGDSCLIEKKRRKVSITYHRNNIRYVSKEIIKIQSISPLP